MSSPTVNLSSPLRPLVRLAWPVMAEEVLNLLVGYTDWWLTGHFLAGAEYKAAMGLMSYVLWLIPSLFAAVAIGATALIARSTGAGNWPHAQRVAHQALLGGLAIGAVATAAAAWGGPTLLQLLRLPAAAQPAAVEYFDVIVPAIPAIMIEQVAIAVLRGAGNTVTGLLAKIVVNLVNAVVSAALVTGWWLFPEIGWRGLAIGTALGHAAGAVILLIALLNGRTGLRWRATELTLEFPLMVRLWKIGLPGGLDVMAVLACHLTYVSIINTLGTEAAAAHGLGVQIEALSYLPASSFAVAAATLTGQYLGAGDARLAERAIRHAAVLGLSFMTFMGVVFATRGSLLVSVFVAPGAEETAKLAADYLWITAWSMPFLALAMIFSGALRGAGDTVWTLTITFAGLALIRVPGAAWLAWSDWTVPGLGGVISGWGWGVHGAWYAMVIDVMLRSALFAARVAHGGWKRLKI